jgi:uroporphyrinogen decarboxylase
MGMTSRERMQAALELKEPDHLPATTHHLMNYFLDNAMGGINDQQFFDHFDLDAYTWTLPLIGDDEVKTWIDNLGFICSDEWRITSEEIPDPQYKTIRFTIHTPKGNLTTVNQYNEHTVWVTEFLIKNKNEIDLLAEFMPVPVCDVAEVNKAADKIGERGLCRGHIIGFDIFGQPGTWQDAACLFGIERLIYESYDDPAWVHALLQILLERKLHYVKTLEGARFDILELGGGDASTTVISPKVFRKFVAPYDSQIIAAAKNVGQRIVYHTCGGMMPILEDIADMGPDAMETFTPKEMGGDTNLAEAKRRIGDRVCMIGGFDQFHFFTNCTEQETRRAVRDAFDAAGSGGGFILSPSDHFFDADINLIAAFADEAKRCVY